MIDSNRLKSPSECIYMIMLISPNFGLDGHYNHKRKCMLITTSKEKISPIF